MVFLVHSLLQYNGSQLLWKAVSRVVHYSNRGTQLVSAGLVLAKKSSKAGDTPDQWDWAQITRKNQASKWHFVPIGSPNFNGLPESTVKVLKRPSSYLWTLVRS